MVVNRFIIIDDVEIFDYQDSKVVAIANNSQGAVHIVNLLNELHDDFMRSIDHRTELNNKLTEAIEKYDNILGLIDIRIKENKQLALLHYPEPGDEYINQYDSRAYELEQLKKLILNGR